MRQQLHGASINKYEAVGGGGGQKRERERERGRRIWNSRAERPPALVKSPEAINYAVAATCEEKQTESIGNHRGKRRANVRRVLSRLPFCSPASFAAAARRTSPLRVPMYVGGRRKT